METHWILGTAGHIDHGKTSLVKALTGIDCDRLPEEKRRGITIDIGFAHLDLGSFHVGIVDVPGHERFIKNMLAGATGIDVAMLVVAADDSVMPQTREHLAILELLGIEQGIVALTKCDLVDDAGRQRVEAEIRDLVQGTFLESAPLVATSVQTGEGLDALKTAIATAFGQVRRKTDNGWFRLAIDRAFVVEGHGTVVTGSVASGSVRVGEEVEWLPLGKRTRVRSLHNHDRPVDVVRRGQRAALNLAGVPHDRVARGQELAAPGYLVPSRVLTARLHALREARPLKHRGEIRLHIGTAEVIGTLSLLDGDTIQPGQSGLGQLFLHDPVTAIWGQPFVLRDSAAMFTLGGGRVLQPVASKVRRRHRDALERIEQLNADETTRAGTVAWFAGLAGVTATELIRSAGIDPSGANKWLSTLRANGTLVERNIGQGRTIIIHTDRLRELEDRILHAVDQRHTKYPLMTAHDRSQIAADLAYLGHEPLVQESIDQLLARKSLVGDGKRIARAEFKPKLSANLAKLKDGLIAAYQQARFAPPDPSRFVPQAGGNAAHLNDLFEVCCAEGRLVAVGPGLYLHVEAEAEMRRRLAERLADGAGLTVAEVRDLLGTTRKYAVPLCEYLDRIGVTRRVGDLRYAAGEKS